jgi:hypothetical protein
MQLLYEAGWSLREVGEMTGTTKGGVRHILDRMGVKRRSQGTGRNLMVAKHDDRADAG